MELLIVTGLSGAGKSQVGNALEDMGFYCVDNVPPAVIPAFVDVSQHSKESLEKIAIVTDVRGGQLFEGIIDVLDDFDARDIKYKILFLDASDEVIIRRYRENRRKHPLNKEAKISIGDAVKKERKTLEKIRNRADFVIDTSHTSLAQLKQKVYSLFCDDISDNLRIQCKSFGFKYGSDRENDLIFDVRCLPNPFYDENLKEKTGLDEEVRDYVLSTEESREFLSKILDFLEFSIPLYIKEGKSQLTVAFGCTGGKHRSVTFAELVGNALKEKEYNCSVVHRDILKR